MKQEKTGKAQAKREQKIQKAQDKKKLRKQIRRGG